MLRSKLLLKVKTVLEHVAISNFFTYLGTNPFSVFVRNHNIAGFMITNKYQVWNHPRNCRKWIIDAFPYSINTSFLYMKHYHCLNIINFIKI